MARSIQEVFEDDDTRQKADAFAANLGFDPTGSAEGRILFPQQSQAIDTQRRRAEVEARNLANRELKARMEAAGQEYDRDEVTGLLRPKTDERGRLLFKEIKPGEKVDYTPAGPVQTTRTKLGETKLSDPDAEAPVGTAPNDPGQLYKKTKYQPWKPLGAAEDVAETAADPRTRRAAQEVAEANRKKLESAGGAAADRMVGAVDLALNQRQQQIDAFNTRAAELNEKLSQIEANPVYRATEGGFLGIGAKPTSAAQVLRAQADQIREELNRIQEERVGHQREVAKLEGEKKAKQLEADIFKETQRQEGFAAALRKRREALRAQGRTLEEINADPILSQIAEKEKEIGAARSWKTRERDAGFNAETVALQSFTRDVPTVAEFSQLSERAAQVVAETNRMVAAVDAERKKIASGVYVDAAQRAAAVERVKQLEDQARLARVNATAWQSVVRAAALAMDSGTPSGAGGARTVDLSIDADGNINFSDSREEPPASSTTTQPGKTASTAPAAAASSPRPDDSSSASLAGRLPEEWMSWDNRQRMAWLRQDNERRQANQPQAAVEVGPGEEVDVPTLWETAMAAAKDGAGAVIGSLMKGLSGVTTGFLDMAGAAQEAMGFDSTYNTAALAEGVRDYWESMIPEEVKGTLPQQLVEGMGSALGFLAPGGVVSKLGGGAKAIAASSGIVGALTQGGQAFSEAKEMGLSEEQAYQRLAVGVLGGATEAVGLGRILGRLDKFTRGGLSKFLLEIAKEGVEEGIQETTQSLITDFGDQLILEKGDPRRKELDAIFQDAAEAGLLGATLGVLFGGGIAVAQRRDAQRAFERENARIAEWERAAASVTPEALDYLPTGGTTLPAKARARNLRSFAEENGATVQEATLANQLVGGSAAEQLAERDARLAEAREALEQFATDAGGVVRMTDMEGRAEAQRAYAEALEEKVGFAERMQARSVAALEAARQILAMPDAASRAVATGLAKVSSGKAAEQLTQAERVILQPRQIVDQTTGAATELPPFVYEQNGGLVITDEAIDWLGENAPAVQDLVESDESTRLAQLSRADESAQAKKPEPKPATPQTGARKAAPSQPAESVPATEAAESQSRATATNARKVFATTLAKTSQAQKALDALGVKKNSRFKARRDNAGRPEEWIKASWSDEGTLTLDYDLDALQDLTATMPEADAQQYVDLAVDEEIRHFAQAEAARREWEKAGRSGTFDEFFTQQYREVAAAMTDAERQQVRDTYGRVADDKLGMEYVRMLLQKGAGGELTEAKTRALAIVEKIVAVLKEALDAIGGGADTAVARAYQQARAVLEELNAAAAVSERQGGPATKEGSYPSQEGSTPSPATISTPGSTKKRSSAPESADDESRTGDAESRPAPGPEVVPHNFNVTDAQDVEKSRREPAVAGTTFKTSKGSTNQVKGISAEANEALDKAFEGLLATTPESGQSAAMPEDNRAAQPQPGQPSPSGRVAEVLRNAPTPKSGEYILVSVEPDYSTQPVTYLKSPEVIRYGEGYVAFVPGEMVRWNEWSRTGFRYFQEAQWPFDSDVYLRVTNTKEDFEHVKNGTHRGSLNRNVQSWEQPKEEGGLSVARDLEVPAKYAYFVRGKYIGRGQDGEPLLELATVKPVGGLLKYETAQKRLAAARKSEKTPTKIAQLSISASEYQSPESRAPSSGALNASVPGQEQWAAQVDRFVSRPERTGAPLVLGATPLAIRQVGLPDLNLSMRPSDVAKVLGQTRDGHTITPEQLKALPAELANPVAVFASESQLGSFVVVTSLRDGQRPVIAAIHGNKREGRVMVNRVASVYGKDRAQAAMQRWIDLGLLRYVSPEKGKDWFQSAGLRLPLEETSRADGSQPGGNVNASVPQQIGVDRARLPQFIEAAQALIDSGIRTPEAMARVLEEKFGGRVRQYSQAFWNAFGIVDPSLSSQPDWNSIYGVPEQPAPADDAKFALARMGENPNDVVARAIASSPQKRASDLILQKLNAREKFDWRELFKMTDAAWNGTQASGAYTVKDAYDALELAVNRLIQESGGNRFPSNASSRLDATSVIERIEKEILDNIPTQSKRTEEGDRMQQFSTPPHFAYMANWVANVGESDVVLEPSAGIGGLAVFAKNAGARVIANELSERRREFLKELGLDAIYGENAEMLSAILEPRIQSGEIPRPTVVVMNPPFSNAAKSGKTRQTIIGAKHVEEALKLLAPGGRLVAIVGEGMAFGKPTFRGWWDRIGRTYNVRANIGVSGENYRKYGTTFDNQLLVIDKTGPTNWDAVVKDDVDSISQLPNLLEGIRNDRKPVSLTEQPSGAQRSEGASSESRPGADANATGAAGNARVESGGTGATGSAGRPGGLPDGAASGQAGGGGRTRAGAGVSEPAGDESAGLGEAKPEGSGEGRAVGGGREPGAVTVRKREKVRAEEPVNEDAVFAAYRPSKVSIPGAIPHPAPLVESAAMAAVEAPDPTYTPNLPREVIEEGRLSEVQLESVVYAGQAHSQLLDTGERKGFFLGDGTGVGKGRQIAGIILDNMRQGRTKAVWISKSDGLIEDAKRDAGDVGIDPESITSLGKTKLGNSISKGEGILFATYDTLKKGHEGLGGDGQPVAKGNRSRLNQLVEWFGKDYDGVIVFDEAHKAGNAVSIRGKRGVKKASAAGMAVVDLQRLLPKARIVYVSATGATEVHNLSYADRLGIWGPGTPFSSKRDFFEKISAGGISSMEIVARDLKALGLYLARSISYQGVQFARLTQELTPEQTQIYNELARAWQSVLQNVDEALGFTNASKNGAARSAALSAFWGGQQRFFNQLLTSMEMPALLSDMEQALNDGHSVVLQLVNTNEAQTKRAVAGALTEAGPEGAVDLEDLDLSPREMLLSYLNNSFPTALFEQVQDPNDPEKTVWQMARDSNGNPIEDPGAVRMRDELLDRVAMLRIPDAPMDQILNRFGPDAVAEITGRTTRLVNRKQEDGTMKRVLERRNPARRRVEAREFQDGKRKILIFSDAGGTGFSFHASNKAKNQTLRMHYLVQAGWRADNALQGFGRTHRSNQKQPPYYKLVETNIKGHKRFLSTIARRLAQLGALTTGERKATGQGMFSESDNLESQYARDGLTRLINEIARNQVEGWDVMTFSRKLGFGKSVLNPDTGETEFQSTLVDSRDGSVNEDKFPSIEQFLNRLLTLELADQNDLFDKFDHYFQTRVTNAMNDGTYDPGTQNYRAAELAMVSDEVVYTHPGSTAVTRIVEVEERNPVVFTQFNEIEAMGSEPVLRYVRNVSSGRVYALKPAPTRTSTSGGIVNQFRRIGTRTTELIDEHAVTLGEGGKYEELTAAQAAEAWDAEIASADKVKRRNVHFLVGSLLPVWDRINLASPRIYRFTTTDGDTMLGVLIPPKEVAGVRLRMGATNSVSPEQLFRSVLDDQSTATLANGWRVRRSYVSGENRIEVIGLDYSDRDEFVNYIGGFVERINFSPRFFISTDEKAGIESFAKLLKKSPVAEFNGQPVAGDGNRGTFDAGDPSILRASVPDPELYAAAQAAMAALDDDAIAEQQERAAREESGQRTVGRPDLSLGALDPQIMGVDEYRKALNDTQSHEQWLAEAKQMLADDYEGTKQAILVKGFTGDTLSAAETKAAKLIVAREVEQARTPEQRRDVARLIYAYRETGREASRQLGSRRDEFQTPAERHREFLAKVVYSVPPKMQRLIDKAKDPQTRRRLVEKATDDRIRKIEDALAKMGVTLDDLFSGEVELSLIGSRIAQNTLRQFRAKEQTVLRLIQQRKNPAAIARVTGMSVQQVEKIRQKAVESIRKRHYAKFKKGATIADVVANRAAGSAAASVPDEVAEAEFQKMIDALGFSDPATRKPAQKVDMNDAVEVVKTAREIAAVADGNVFNMVHEYWINSILSGFLTQAANAAGNAINLALNTTIYRGAEALLNAVPLLGRDADSARLGEFRYLVRGFMPGVVNGFRAAVRAFDAETSLFAHEVLDEPIDLEGLERGYGVGRGSIRGRKGRVVRIPTRKLLFLDEFFKYLTGHMEVGAQAYRIGKASGLSGADLENFIAEEIATPGSASWERAVAAAVTTTFQDNLRSIDEGGNWVEGAAEMLQKGLRRYAPGRFFIPFIRSIYNFFRQGMRRSPIGTATMLYKLAREGFYRVGPDGRVNPHPYAKSEFLRDASEQAIAWMLTALLYGAAEGDDDDLEKAFLITGSRPFKMGDQAYNDLDNRTGTPAYSIVVHGRPVFNYGRLEPIATVLGTTVDVIKQIKNGRRGADVGQVLGGLVEHVANQTTNKTFGKGLNDIAGIVADPTGQTLDWAMGFAASFVPNIIRQPLRSMDELVRETSFESMPDDVVGRAGEKFTQLAVPIAGINQPKIDAYGRTIRKGGTAATRALIPAETRPRPVVEQADLVLRKWNRDHPEDRYAPRKPTRKFKDPLSGEDRVMNDYEYRVFSERAGRIAAEKLRAIVTPGMVANPTREDVEAIRKAFNDSRAEARDELFRLGLLPPPPREGRSIAEMLFGNP